MGDAATTLAGMITNMTTVAQSVVSLVRVASEEILSNPLLFYTLGIFAIGAAIGVLSRLLSRN